MTNDIPRQLCPFCRTPMILVNTMYGNLWGCESCYVADELQADKTDEDFFAVSGTIDDVNDNTDKVEDEFSGFENDLEFYPRYL